MNNDLVVKAKGSGLDWLLDDLVKRLAGAEQAVVLSADGLLLGRSAGLQREDGEHLAAMASAFRSLARGVGTTFDKGEVQQTVVELELGYLVVTEAGEGACLALLAGAGADLGMVAYEMNVVVQQVGANLTAAPRSLHTDLRIPHTS
ncbi:roadblock/LC7 domain-containing protein [Amycolatopsis cynarae]|uniref:Roadblock/LC7 domain-containing protein n=1 Tax=Amycolatopsis cynarae TaxID=2995223 RepID=A0ABY7AWJ4_9PSEU|nr:roadblock/LC7 domain-containing protein [Amycolatopsis sp. HUAS 11-8]WAL64326.1 roadblock/LC7 domain-containing protein [Amycolatopsis sp. HUAS 11-8]